MIESKLVTETSEVVTRVVRQMLEPFNITGGLPDGFWSDAYALGFLQGTIVTLAKIKSRNELRDKNVAQVALNVFKALAPGQGAQIYRTTVDFHAQKDPVYATAMNNGFISIGVIFGSQDFNDRPEVQKARAMAEETIAEMGREGDKPSPAETGSMLHYLLFQTPVAERLGTKQQEFRVQ